MKNTKSKQSKFVRFLTAPFRKLNKVYMTGMSNCSATMDLHMGAENFSMGPQALPRNFSVSSTKGSNKEDDLSDLIRVVSTRFNAGNKIDDMMKVPHRRQGMLPLNTGRSYSVGIGKIGKIDEEKPCDDFEEVEIDVVAYPRSRSDYAFARRNNLVPINVYQPTGSPERLQQKR